MVSNFNSFMDKTLFKSKTKFKQYNLYLQELSKKITEINLDFLKEREINETILKEIENYLNIKKMDLRKGNYFIYLNCFVIYHLKKW